MAQKDNASGIKELNKGRLIWLLIVLLGLYIVLPQLGRFHDSLHAIGNANMAWLGIAALAMAGTYVLAALIYVFLSRNRLKLGQTVLVQFAGMFVNRLLPAGIGAIGINYRYLRRNKHSPPAAGAVVAVNNGLGFIGNMLLLVTFLIVGHNHLKPKVSVHVSSTVYWIIVAVLLVGLLLWLSRYRRRLQNSLEGLIRDIMAYRHELPRLSGALICSIALTLLYSVTLYACSRAVGIHLAFDQIFIIMTVGVAGATAIPTPGGLGGAEAALVGGMVLYGITDSTALAAVLLYRLFTYWLALLIGAGAFVFVQRRKYI